MAWLLVLAGPLGWIGLFVIAALQRGEMLAVTLPYSEAAYGRRTQAHRTRRWAAAVIGAVVLAMLSLPLHSTDGRLLAVGLAIVACGARAKTIVAWVHLNRLTVRLHLDASRRWVTLVGVHPNFVEAFEHDDQPSPLPSSP